ncbi:class I adenylate-forming enzyme family protein [Streptomyces sp. NPDC058299]|uniref:class I adenylate-forming enzyme family protein n=1 Tax=unclassified Streptomyces TaxID=2593676 RepID=UPI0036ECA13C
MPAGPSPGSHYVTVLLDVLDRAPGDRPVLWWREHRWSAREFAARTWQLAVLLGDTGVRPGEVLGLLVLPNHPDTLAARYAAHLLGLSVVHLHTANPGSNGARMAPAEQAELLRNHNATILLHTPELADRAHSAAKRLPAPPRILPLPGPATLPADRTTALRAAPTVPGGLLTFTGGTTGRPRGVRHSFAGHNELVLGDAVALTASPQPPRMLVTTPLSHAVAAMADAVLCAGGSLVLHEDFEPAKALRAMELHRVDRAYLAVPQLHRLVDHPDVPGTDLSALRQLVYSGSTAAPARVARAVEVLGAVLVQCYGSTEAGRITLLDQLDHLEPELLGSVGRPFPGVDVRVVTAGAKTAETELPPGRTGEIWARSRQCMIEYTGDPEATARTLHDGWVRTGDLGHIDDYGCLRLVGRCHDVIKVAGERVRPAAVEQVMLAGGDFTDVVVHRATDGDGTEAVHAAVVAGPRPVPDALLTAALARAAERVTRDLTQAHVPTRVVLWPRLPLTPAGKPDRRRLAEPDETAGARLITPKPGE